MKGIKKNKHGILDYIYVPLVFAAPRMAGFENDKQACGICYAFSTAVLSYTLLTDAKWGLVKLIPYKTHLAIDIASGVAALAVAATYERSNQKIRTTFLLMGLTAIVAGTLSIIGAKNSDEL